MPFTGKEDFHISLNDAVKLVKNFRANPLVPNIKGGYFGQAIYNEILAQPGCVGIRSYYGQHDDGSPAIVMVGVLADGSELINGTIAEELTPCPPMCWVASPFF